ncbi:hypothetical protein [Lentzea aerocolonigenes]|uniref:hypothetical protein n=1 Tax=Lentzea aerocolonigenes TaxID=68170 RepID=UPI0018C87D7A|nr:hypothetical protein [Lentzea aerocolonigenes]
MYGWLWRVLPGGAAIRVALLLVLLTGVLALLWYLVFPFVDRLLPFDDVTVS